MAYTNGLFELGSSGVYTDFLSAVKDGVLSYTDWTLDEENSNEYSYVFNTNIDDVMVKIYNASATSSEYTSAFNNIRIVPYKGSTELSYVQATFSGSAAQSTETTRTLKLLVHTNSNATILGFLGYNTSKPSYSTILGFCKATDIASGETSDMFFNNGTIYNIDTLASQTLTRSITASCTSGVIMKNLLGFSSSTIASYLPNFYNCSTLTAGSYYQINGKKYYTVDPNILVEE